MFRRWQKEAVGRFRTLESFNTFLARLTPLRGPEVLQTCDPADLYAVLSVLHSKSRNPQLQINTNPGFYYFLADAVQPDGKQEGADPSPPAADTVVAENADSARREAVVPIRSKSTQLTMENLAKFFKLEAHPNVTHILLGIVDDDGSVSLIRVFNYLQPPFEGPDALPPLDAEGGGVGGESDDD